MSMERHISVLVEIVYTLSGRGLTKDAVLLSDTIRSLGHEVSVKALPPQHPQLRELSGKWGRVKKRLPSRRAIDLANSLQRAIRRILSVKTPNGGLVIHLENIHPHHINPRCPNWLIPNQEWFRTERSHYLNEIDAVLCKTQVAENRFKSLHEKVGYLGFSVPGAIQAPTLELHRKQSGFCLHVAGSSLSKGTSAVIDAWEMHPEWPPLTIVANSVLVERPLPANITLKKNISSEELEQLWQRATIAVIPSEVEGYGQVLGEAMLAGAVMVTTDAPPMNELVTESRGYLVPWVEESPWRLGTRYRVTSGDLEICLERVLAEPAETIESKAKEAYGWVIDNHQGFVERLGQFLHSAESDTDPVNRQSTHQPG